MNKKSVVVIAIIAALVIMLTATYIFTRPVATPNVVPPTNTETSNEADPTPQTSSEDAESAEATTITYTDQGFTPASLSVKSGAALRIINNSSAPLEFSSDNHPSHRENPEMNMSTLQPGQEGIVTVTTPGEHGFHDHLNASRTGILTVTK
jgi:plastocyanin